MTETGVQSYDLGIPGDASAVHLDRAPLRLIVMALAGGAVFEIGLRGGGANVVVSAGVVIVVVMLLSDQRISRPEPRRLALAATVPAAFLIVRASPWLAVSNLVATGALLSAAVAYARSGSVLHTTPRHAFKRGAAAMRAASGGLLRIPAVIPMPPSPLRNRMARVGRAAVVASPLLIVVSVLLASADAVFASLLVPDIDAGGVLGHVVLIVVAGAGVLCVGLAPLSDADDDVAHGQFGAAEIATMLVLASGVLGLFVVSQLLALTDGGRRAIESSGLTPAEYARSGFFQLCWATALLVLFLVLVRTLAAPEPLQRRSIRLLGCVVPVLATGLVIVSLRRMALYDRAFGLTMLRLWVIGAAIWMGAVLVMTAVRNLGMGKHPRWVLAGAGAAGIALVLVADLANPEAFVVRHNVARADAGAELDGGYLATLSDDATPAIARASASATDKRAGALIAGALRCEDDRHGVATLNLAVARAAKTRREVCPH